MIRSALVTLSQRRDAAALLARTTRTVAAAVSARGGAAAVAVAAATPHHHHHHHSCCCSCYFSTGTAGSRSDEVEGGLNAEQLQALDEMFGKMDKLQAELSTLRAQVKEMAPLYGVDAPDGESDAELASDMHVVEEYIEEAALHEDANLVNKQHKLEDDVKKFHARDPEHDW